MVLVKCNMVMVTPQIGDLWWLGFYYLASQVPLYYFSYQYLHKTAKNICQYYFNPWHLCTLVAQKVKIFYTQLLIKQQVCFTSLGVFCI